MAGNGMEQLFEQPDLSIDIKNNGRINISLLSLNDSSTKLVDEISVFLKSLPPFQHEDGNATVSLRVLKGIPYWAREKKGESEGLLNGSKKIYGLICVAKCRDVDDLTDASLTYAEQLGHLSTNPLMVTRCVVFGSGKTLGSELKGKSGFTLIDSSGESTTDDELNNLRTQMLTIIKHCVTVIYSNITTLLGDKKSQWKAGSLPHSMDTALDDDETKRQHGRSSKAQGDYHLLLGEYGKATELYREGLAALEKLSKKEYVWLGAIFESMLATNLLRKDIPSTASIMFELSLADTNATSSDTSLDKLHPFSSSDKENVAEVALSGDMSDIDGNLTDFREDKVDKNFQNALQYYNKAGIVGKKPLFELYLKYAGYLVEQELREQLYQDANSAWGNLEQNYVAACKQLNEAQIVLSSDEELFTPLLLSLYLTLSELYHFMGLKRKTVFMMFNAGREAVRISSTSSGQELHYGNLKQKAFEMLTHCLKEFGIISDKEDEGSSPVDIKGWPLLQAMALMEYVHLCWKLNYYDILIRWAWLCLQTFYPHLPMNDVKSLTEKIALSAGKIKESTDTYVQAPFQVLSVPQISQLKPQVLAPSLSVKQSKTLFPSALSSEEKEGPFIFNAMNKKDKGEVLWVQGDPAELLLVLSNPLPVEMKVEKMTVVLQGAKVTTYPSTIALPASCGEPQQLVLLCIPSEPGHLSLTGYSAFIFGLLNTSSIATEISIKVLPSLPQLRVKSLPKLLVSQSNFSYIRSMSKDFIKPKTLSKSTFELMDGEVYECILQLQSIGDVPVNNIKISVSEKNSSYCSISWDEDELQSFVPLEVKNKTLSLSVKIAVKLPPSQRIGPSKVEESHMRSVLRRRHSKPKNEILGTAVIPKSNTLVLPTRGSAENELGEFSKIPSPSGSPRRFSRITGSLRRPKKEDDSTTTEEQKHQRISIQSLDLHKSKVKQDGCNLPVTVDTAQTPDETASKNRFLQLKETPGTPKTSRPSIKRSLAAKLKSFTSVHSGPQEPTVGGGATGPEGPSPMPSPAKPKSPPISIPDGRLMDSLNLEFPLASDLRVSNENYKSRDSTLSDSTTDTTSGDAVDFDTHSGDRVSITSDPGVLMNAQTTKGNTPPSFIKSATVSMHQKEKKQYVLYGNDESSKKSVKQFSSVSKKPLIPLHSLPMNTAPQPGPSQNAPGLPFIISTKGVLRKKTLIKRDVTITFLFQYTGGEGAKEGYYRESSEDLKVSIQPALYLFDFSVIPVKGSADQFSFLFTIINVSPYNLVITIDVKQEGSDSHKWVLDSHISREVALPMKRFTLENHEATLNEKNILKPYCDHLASLLDVRWFSPDQNKGGNIQLTGLDLPHSVVASIRPLPVIFNYKTEAVSYSPGISVAVNIDITNNTDSTLPPCAINLKPFTVSPADGSKIDCVKAKTIIHSQSLTQWLPEISVGFTYKLLLNMIFLCHGEYFIDVILHKRKDEEETSHESDNVTKSSESCKKFTKCTSIIDGSVVRPNSKTRPDFKSHQEVISMKNSKLGNISDFIMQSKAYAGPQLIIKIY